MTASTYKPKGSLEALYQYLRDTHKIVDIENCEGVDTSLLSEQVRQLMSKGKSDWEKLVTPEVRDLIKKKKLFARVSN